MSTSQLGAYPPESGALHELMGLYDAVFESKDVKGKNPDQRFQNIFIEVRGKLKLEVVGTEGRHIKLQGMKHKNETEEGIRTNLEILDHLLDKASKSADIAPEQVDKILKLEEMRNSMVKNLKLNRKECHIIENNMRDIFFGKVEKLEKEVTDFKKNNLSEDQQEILQGVLDNIKLKKEFAKSNDVEDLHALDIWVTGVQEGFNKGKISLLQEVEELKGAKNKTSVELRERKEAPERLASLNENFKKVNERLKAIHQQNLPQEFQKQFENVETLLSKVRVGIDTLPLENEKISQNLEKRLESISRLVTDLENASPLQEQLEEPTLAPVNEFLDTLIDIRSKITLDTAKQKLREIHDSLQDQLLHLLREEAGEGPIAGDMGSFTTDSLKEVYGGYIAFLKEEEGNIKGDDLSSRTQRLAIKNLLEKINAELKKLDQAGLGDVKDSVEKLAEIDALAKGPFISADSLKEAYGEYKAFLMKEEGNIKGDDLSSRTQRLAIKKQLEKINTEIKKLEHADLGAVKDSFEKLLDIDFETRRSLMIAKEVVAEVELQAHIKAAELKTENQKEAKIALQTMVKNLDEDLNQLNLIGDAIIGPENFSDLQNKINQNKKNLENFIQAIDEGNYAEKKEEIDKFVGLCNAFLAQTEVILEQLRVPSAVNRFINLLQNSDEQLGKKFSAELDKIQFTNIAELPSRSEFISLLKETLASASIELLETLEGEIDQLESIGINSEVLENYYTKEWSKKGPVGQARIALQEMHENLTKDLAYLGSFVPPLVREHLRENINKINELVAACEENKYAEKKQEIEKALESSRILHENVEVIVKQIAVRKALNSFLAMLNDVNKELAKNFEIGVGKIDVSLLHAEKEYDVSLLPSEKEFKKLLKYTLNNLSIESLQKLLKNPGNIRALGLSTEFIHARIADIEAKREHAEELFNEPLDVFSDNAMVNDAVQEMIRNRKASFIDERLGSESPKTLDENLEWLELMRSISDGSSEKFKNLLKTAEVNIESLEKKIQDHVKRPSAKAEFSEERIMQLRNQQGKYITKFKNILNDSDKLREMKKI